MEAFYPIPTVTYATIVIAPCEHIELYLSNDNFRRTKFIPERGCSPG